MSVVWIFVFFKYMSPSYVKVKHRSDEEVVESVVFKLRIPLPDIFREAKPQRSNDCRKLFPRSNRYRIIKCVVCCRREKSIEKVEGECN